MLFTKLSFLIVVICFGFVSRAETSAEYFQKTSKLKTLDTRMEDTKKSIVKMIEEKNETQDENHRKALVEEIKAAHKNMVKDLSEYNKLWLEVEYKYPEKGMDLREKFVMKKEQTIEEIEREGNIDQQLTEVKRNMDKKYAPITGWKPETKEDKLKEMSEKEKPADKKRLKLVK